MFGIKVADHKMEAVCIYRERKTQSRPPWILGRSDGYGLKERT
jgi:hypothetical protein